MEFRRQDAHFAYLPLVQLKFPGHAEPHRGTDPCNTGVNSGTLAVRGAIFEDVMAEWERIDEGEPPQGRHCSDQGSWNRLLLDHATRWTSSVAPRWKAIPFERGEVRFPMYLHPKYGDYKDAALVHCLGGDTRDKLKFMFGLHMSTFFWEDASTMVSLLEV